MKILTPEEFKAKYGEVGVAQMASIKQTQPTIDKQKTITEKAGEVSTGIAKGVLGTTIGTAQMLQGFGKKVLDPTGKNPTIQNMGFKSLEGQQAEEINKQLESKTGYETAGKVLEFVGELLYPVGKAEEVAGLLNKGKNIASKSFGNLAEKASMIDDNLVEGGVKVKDKLINLVSTLDDKTKTALTRTPKPVFDKFVNMGRNALKDDRIQTPLEFVGESVANGLRKVKEIATTIGQKKSEMLKLPEGFVGDGIKKFNEGINSFMNSRSLIENDKSIVKRIYSQFKALGNTPSKGQVDKFIDFAQGELYAGEKNLTLPMSNKTTAGLKNLIGNLNSSLKNQLPKSYRALNDQYSKLSSLMSELNIKLGKEGGNAGSLIKRLFSPSDARTKELFDELGKLTGQDYFRDARLAKFVMEAVGDTRATSLLEQIPKSKGQVVDRVIDWIIKKTGISDPIQAAESFLKQQEKLLKK